jgi:hypothetical protein
MYFHEKKAWQVDIDSGRAASRHGAKRYEAHIAGELDNGQALIRPNRDSTDS